MTPHDLATAIKLSPRAIIIAGTLTAREKKSEDGMITGFTPHHAKQGVPVVPFNGEEPAPILQVGACIECAISEQTLIPSVATAYGRPLNLVHLIFGNASLGPNANEYKVLREAGQILQANTNRPIMLVSLPVLTPGQYGVAQGRHYILGLFAEDGTPLFLNPAAVDAKVLVAQYPENQKIRTTADFIAPVQAPAPTLTAPAWYPAMADTLAVALKLKGSKLHEAVLSTRAAHIAKEQKITPKAALAAVTAEFESFKAQAATAAPKVIPATTQPATPARKSFLSARV